MVLEGIEQRDLLLVDQVVPRATITLVLDLLELNYEVCSLKSRRLVTHLREGKLSAFRVSGLNLDLLTAG